MLPKSVNNVVQLYKSNLEYSERRRQQYMNALMGAQKKKIPWRFANKMEQATTNFVVDFASGDETNSVYQSYLRFLQDPENSLSPLTKFLIKSYIAEWEQETSGWNDRSSVKDKEFFRGLYDELYYRCPDFRVLSVELKFILDGDFDRTHPIAHIMLAGRDNEIQDAAARFLRSNEEPVTLLGLHLQFFLCGRNAPM